MKKKLTPKQTQFVKEYLIDLNATQAAIRSGYSKKTSHATGQENLKKPIVKAAIQEAIKKRSEKTDITAEYVLSTIKETIERCKDPDTYDSKAILKGCELLAKHLGLLKDKVEHTGSNGAPVQVAHVTTASIKKMLSEIGDKI